MNGESNGQEGSIKEPGTGKRPIVIVLAEDDDDDYLLTVKALRKSYVLNHLHRVRDGEELMEYLLRQGVYADPARSPRPGVILLDLNMPRKDGREALLEIRAKPELSHIPVVVLTTSKAEEDVLRSYRCGANSYIKKPVEFAEFVEVVRAMGRYWFEIVELPEGRLS
ncbi:MAG: response regulator [Magnetococcales bacterium]|nr:response regulator [Magnetococcales bacterium]